MSFEKKSKINKQWKGLDGRLVVARRNLSWQVLPCLVKCHGGVCSAVPAE